MGGLARSFPLGDTWLEEYYHHIFLTDTYTIKLIEQLGLKEKTTWEESKMGVYCEDKVHPFGTLFDLMQFKPFSFIDKLRFSLSTLYLIKRKDYKNLKEITAEGFLLKIAGSNVYRKLWEPLLATKFGLQDYKKVAVEWLRERVSSRGKSKKGIFEREKLGYLNGGLKVLFDELQKRIMESSGAILKAAYVERVNLDKDGKLLVHSNKNSGIFDICCLCVPNPIILKITGHLFSRQYISTYLESIKYRAVLCAVLTIKESLSPYYWINISQEGVPFTGFMEHTNFISKASYGENHIIYLGRYISPDQMQYNMNDDELIDFYAGHIKDIFPKFNKAMIKQSFVFKDLYAQPIITKDNRDKIPFPISPVRNIFINNTIHTYPVDRGMDAGIRKSFELSKIIDNIK